MADEPEHGAEDEQRCPSRNLNGVWCERQIDHADFHSATVEGVGYVWSGSPNGDGSHGRQGPHQSAG